MSCSVSLFRRDAMPEVDDGPLEKDRGLLNFHCSSIIHPWASTIDWTDLVIAVLKLSLPTSNTVHVHVTLEPSYNLSAHPITRTYNRHRIVSPQSYHVTPKSIHKIGGSHGSYSTHRRHNDPNRPSNNPQINFQNHHCGQSSHDFHGPIPYARSSNDTEYYMEEYDM